MVELHPLRLGMRPVSRPVTVGPADAAPNIPGAASPPPYLQSPLVIACLHQ